MNEPGPLGPVKPDDPPMAFCHTHDRKYNPYSGGCPDCK